MRTILAICAAVFCFYAGTYQDEAKKIFGPALDQIERQVSAVFHHV